MKHLNSLLIISFLWITSEYAHDKPKVLLIWDYDVDWANVNKFNINH